MIILALETATDNCSCALLDSQSGEITCLQEQAPRRHAERILPMIDQLLAETGTQKTQLSGIAFGCGPGSFTGLRLAAAVTQGIALGLDLPVAPVSTLAALAQGQYRQHQHDYVLSALDARMSAVYWGLYRNDKGIMSACQADQESLPDKLPAIEQAEDCIGAGSGWLSYQPELQTVTHIQHLQAQAEPQAQDLLPAAKLMLQAGKGVTAEQALPVYLRDKVVRS